MSTATGFSSSKWYPPFQRGLRMDDMLPVLRGDDRRVRQLRLRKQFLRRCETALRRDVPLPLRQLQPLGTRVRHCSDLHLIRVLHGIVAVNVVAAAPRPAMTIVILFIA